MLSPKCNFVRVTRRPRWQPLLGLLLLAGGCEVAQPPAAPPASSGASATPRPNPARLPSGPAGAPVPSPDAPPPVPALPLVQARDGRFVDADGAPVRLRGCNLGNWLLLEMWMLDLPGVADQHQFETILAARFGEARKDALLETYRANYITERDFDLIRSFGFNCVRLPFEYRLLEDDRAPRQLKPDAFRWLDRAVEMAGAAGLYVILDLHGTPGRQSLDHTTGRVDQNRLWRDPACQERTVWLWTEIARHFRDSTTVAGYDLINEPFGDGHSADHLPALADLMDRLYRAVREQDDHHVVFVAGARQGLDHYGSPAGRGWTNVAFTEHYYPGLFGSDPTLDTHARFLGQHIPIRAARFRDLGVPFLVGEFNVVHRRLGGPALMRRYFDAYAEHGWAATMWAYKLLVRAGGAGGDFWGMVANRDPLPAFDPRASSFEDVQAFFASLSTAPLAVNDDLRAQLTTDHPEAMALPSFPLLRDAPHREDIPGWHAEDIGGARAGGQRRHGAQAVEIYGGGRDIWKQADQFRFLWQEAIGDLRFTARLDRLDDCSAHAKAGLMLRAGPQADTAHALIHAFPDGRILLGWRARNGAVMEERELAAGDLPVYLALERRHGGVQAGFSRDGRRWQMTPVPVELPERARAGLAVLAHAENEYLTTALFQEINLQR
jgi:endoglucanase